MKPLPVRFCVGCGYVCDEMQSEAWQTQWMNAHQYLTKYKFRWEDLDRKDDACPACARLFAIAGRGVHPVGPPTASAA